MPVILFGKEGDNRTWTDSTGTKTFQGTFKEVQDEKVVIEKEGGEEFSLPLTRLHNDDVAWIEDRVSPAGQYDPGVFDSINFGDSKSEVIDKLKVSKLLERKLGDEILSSRGSFNGLYHTRAAMGGLNYILHIDFDEDKVSGIDLQSEAVSRYSDKITQSWTEAVELLSQMYGDPDHAATNIPTEDDVRSSGGIVGTHKWETDKGGLVILGPSINNEKDYFVCIRITQL